MADGAVDARIDLFLTELKMPSIRKAYRKIAKQVTQHGGDYVAFLHAVIEEEVNDRRARRIDRRIQEARFPQIKELTDLQEDALPKGISLAQIFLGEHLKPSQSGTLQIQPVEVADDRCVATLRGEARGL